MDLDINGIGEKRIKKTASLMIDAELKIGLKAGMHTLVNLLYLYASAF